jgi:adenine/guanine phosphoribosyltransferase-like PRPP-binding protein
MQLIYFKKDTGCVYPVGASFNRNRDYIVEVARTIHTIAGKDKRIALICRGTSGTILAGAVGYILKKKQHDVNIIVSRKCEENSHDYSMSGIGFLAPSSSPFSVVIDDFMDTGNTIKAILNDIDSNVTLPVLDMLCVDNYLSDEKIAENPIIYELLQRFNYVLCNKARKKCNDESITINGYDVP